MVAVHERERIGRSALSSALGMRIFGRSVLTLPTSRGGTARYWPEWWLARARSSSDVYASSGAP